MHICSSCCQMLPKIYEKCIQLAQRKSSSFRCNGRSTNFPRPWYREVSRTSWHICTAAGPLFVNAFTSALWFNWMWPSTATESRHFIKTWHSGPTASYLTVGTEHTAETATTENYLTRKSKLYNILVRKAKDMIKIKVTSRLGLTTAVFTISVFEWVLSPGIESIQLSLKQKENSNHY